MVSESDRTVEAFALQTEWCRRLDSAMYETMLGVATQDLRDGGVVAEIVADFDLDPVSSALPLRLMGGVHRLVLMGVAGPLASHYPTVGGTPHLGRIGADFLASIREHPGYLRDGLAVAPQTNDIGRSAPLIAGLFSVLGNARRVRLLEIGSAGGLNLLLDRYRYDTSAWSWGDPASEAVIEVEWTGDAPPSRPGLDIVERRGCDVMPLDVTDPELQLRLLSFVWPDQPARFERTRGALAIAARHRPSVDRAEAASWIGEMLADEAPRRTITVIQHSVMWQYLDEVSQREIESAIEAAGTRATRIRPFAHISFEPGPAGYEGGGMVLRAVSWPGRSDRVLGVGHPHGAWFRWQPELR